MIQIDVQLDRAGLEALDGVAERIPWALQRLLGREAELAARDMKEEMARQKIASTSLMINSVRADAINPLTWQVGPHVAHARYVLEGRKPGGRMPPWRAIQDWMKVRRLGSDRASAWAVARAIARRGIKPRDYLTPVADRITARLVDSGATVVSAAMEGGRVG